jgi:hypothetical protein
MLENSEMKFQEQNGRAIKFAHEHQESNFLLSTAFTEAALEKFVPAAGRRR